MLRFKKEDIIRDITKEVLTEEIKKYLIIFGEIELKIEKKENNTHAIKVIDRDKSQYTISKDGIKEDKTIDMSGVYCTISLDEKNTVCLIEHGFGMFTRFNQVQSIYLASLIGTTIIDI